MMCSTQTVSGYEDVSEADATDTSFCNGSEAEAKRRSQTSRKTEGFSRWALNRLRFENINKGEMKNGRKKTGNCRLG
jgi:hypothetical protein